MDGQATIHVAGWPLIPGSTDFQHWIPLVKRCSNVTVNSRAEPTQRLVDRPLGSLGLCVIHPCGADDFDIGQLYFVIP
jgi:hypothetical protein